MLISYMNMKLKVIYDISIFESSSYLIKSIESLSYETPTEIQKEAIPHILESKDVIAEAQPDL